MSDGLAGAAAVARARALQGTRFRLQGRERATGLDCVGLVLRAYALTDAAAPLDYGWRNDPEQAAAWLGRVFDPADGHRREGDVLVALLPRGRLHLALWTGRGVVHADAALGRICERPGAPPWAITSAWRERD